MSILKRLKIAPKIFGGFGLVLLLLVSISILGLVTLTGIGSDFDR